MVPDPRLSFLFYCTLFFISGKINKYERQYKAACLLKLTVSSDPYTSTQTARPRPAGAWRGRNSGNRTWWPCIFRQQVAGFLFVPAELYEDQIAEIIVAVEQKAVVSINPALSREFSDILRTNRQDIAAVLILERLDLRVCPFKFLPQFFRIGRRIFRLLQVTQNLRIFKLRGDHGRCGGS